jgi:hypothetical protein
LAIASTAPHPEPVSTVNTGAAGFFKIIQLNQEICLLEYNLYAMHLVVYSSPKENDIETVYVIISSENT